MSYGTAWLGLDRPTLLEWDLALTTDNSPTQTNHQKTTNYQHWPSAEEYFQFKVSISVPPPFLLKYYALRSGPSARLHSSLLQAERSSHWLKKGPGQCKSKLEKIQDHLYLPFPKKFAPDLLSIMWENVQAVLNIHLPAARTPEETHAQIQVVRINFSDHNSDCSFESQVYFVTVDKKSKAVSLSHAKDNKVVVYKFAFSVSSS